MDNKEIDMASEPMAASLSESVCRSGLLGQVMRLSRPDKMALMAYLQKDIDADEAFKTDEFGRIILTQKMREAVVEAERRYDKGECLSEEGFTQRFAKWL